MSEQQELFYSCRTCGKVLTNRKSQLRGFGPVCYSRKNPSKNMMMTELSEDPIIRSPEHLEEVSLAVCNCGISLGNNIPFHGYEHEGGQYVEKENKTIWLYKVCPKCQYQWAFEKLKSLHNNQKI